MDFIFNLAINCFDFIIIYKYLNTFFGEKKYSTKIIFMVLLFLSIMHAIINSFSLPLLNIVSTIVFCFLSSMLFESSLNTRFILCIIFICIGLLTEPLGFLIFNLSLTTDVKPDNYVYFTSILIEIIRFILIFLLCHCKRSEYEYFPLEITLRLVIFPVMSIIGCCTLAHLAIRSTRKQDITICLIMCLVLLFMNYFIFFIFDKFNNMMIERRETDLLLQEMLYKEDYYNEVNNSNLLLREIKHNLKNELIGVYNLIDEDSDKCKTLMNNIFFDLDNSDSSYFCDNVIINAVLRNKNQVAKTHNIELISHIYVPSQLSIEPKELCLLFGNLLDNSIEACQKVIGRTKIYLDIQYVNNCLVITIKNDKLYNEIFTFTSTKKDKQNHGFGLKSVKKIVDKYNGIFKVQDTGKSIQIDIILYGITIQT